MEIGWAHTALTTLYRMDLNSVTWVATWDGLHNNEGKQSSPKKTGRMDLFIYFPK